ncbi:hypothetical protein [Pelagibius sp. Alg239-R121]|uniref:hypothetical protein n=1 Tax=Pelagibius sp. Alg239-R121 TaxID=2993448 RepID=UPI0024A762C9|nr:hypothetical protein [Pelagibius sp. Alg239-R121]
MRQIIDETKVFPLEEAPDKLPKEDLAYFNDLVDRSRKYLESFRWCDRVVEIRVGFFVEELLGVFLLEIETSRVDVDELIWVVMGDLPPAYIGDPEPGACPNAICALSEYVGAMFEWVEAVEKGRSVENLIRVNAAPTKEYAEMLRWRLEHIEENILPDFKELIDQTAVPEEIPKP